MRMVGLPPTDEVPQISAIAIDGLLAAAATALGEEPLEKELVSPDDSASLGSIKKTTDVGQRLCLIQAHQNCWKLVGRFVGKRFARV